MKKANLIKFISSNSSEDEQREVLKWLEASSENRAYFEHLKTVWVLSALPQERADISEYMNFKSKYSLKNGKKSYRIFYISIVAVAASILLFLFLTPNFYQKDFVNDYSIHLTNTGDDLAYHTLPDGSRVTLFQASNLYYNPRFIDSREVRLEGEGYFEVTADVTHPFTVHTASGDVNVTGTKFLVNVLQKETAERMIVFLEEGRVEVKPLKGDEQIALRPGELLTIGRDYSFNISKTDNFPVLDALTENLSFKNEKMCKILKKLESYHNVIFVCHSANIKEMLFTGDLKDETLDSLLELFFQTMGVQYSVKEMVVNLY